MHVPTSLRFELANGLAATDVSRAKFYIYAHECSHGIYVGLAQDPVKRWQEHLLEAHNRESREYNSKFRKALRARL